MVVKVLSTFYVGGNLKPSEVRRVVEQAIAAAAGGVQTLADEIGVSYGTVWAWAKGTRNPSAANRKKLARVLRKRAAKLDALADQLEHR